MCDHPGKMGVGIDEATAILVQGSKARVVGESQVIVVNPMDSCNVHFRHYGMRNIQMNIYTSGEEFTLSNK
jgi:cyanophycinase